MEVCGSMHVISIRGACFYVVFNDDVHIFQKNLWCWKLSSKTHLAITNSFYSSFYSAWHKWSSPSTWFYCSRILYFNGSCSIFYSCFWDSYFLDSYYSCWWKSYKHSCFFHYSYCIWYLPMIETSILLLWWLARSSQYFLYKHSVIIS